MQFWLYNIYNQIKKFSHLKRVIRGRRVKYEGAYINMWLRIDTKSNEEGRSLKYEKNNMVIIEKRIHLFPYRTQKLSSSSLMVLRPKGLGRVGRSQLYSKVAQRRSTRLLTGRLWVRVPPLEPCRSGGTGRRTGLKILRIVIFVPVRFRSSAPIFLISRSGAVGSSSGS